MFSSNSMGALGYKIMMNRNSLLRMAIKKKKELRDRTVKNNSMKCKRRFQS